MRSTFARSFGAGFQTSQLLSLMEVNRGPGNSQKPKSGPGAPAVPRRCQRVESTLVLRVLRPGHRPDLSCPAAPPGSGSSSALVTAVRAVRIRRRSAHMLCCSFGLQAARGLDNCGLSASSESSSRAFGGGCGGTQWLLSLPAPPRHRGLSRLWQVQWRARRRSPARRPTQAWCENLQQLQLKVSSRAVRAAHEEAG